LRSSIFEKICPQCASSKPVTTVRCTCGYCFESDKLDGSMAALENEAQEEKLYLDYLTARLAQAEEDLKRARAAAAEDPESHNKAAEVLAAEQAMLSARAELSEQVARVHGANQKLLSVRSVTRQEAQKAKAAPVIALKPQSKPAPPPKPVAKPAVPVALPKAVEMPVEKPKKKKSRGNGDKTVELVVPAPKVAQEEPRKQSKREITSQIVVRRPTAEFRAMQAARAKRIMEQETRKETTPAPTKRPAVAPNTDAAKPAASAPAPKPVALAVATAIPMPPAAPARSRVGIPRIKEAPRAVTPAPAAVPAPKPTPVAAMPAAPATTPALTAAVAPIFTTETKDCPNCWGKVSLTTVRCRCGYEFSGGPQIPGLSISSSDFAEFFGDLGFTKPT
jgi:hypothetical protein